MGIAAQILQPISRPLRGLDRRGRGETEMRDVQWEKQPPLLWCALSSNSRLHTSSMCYSSTRPIVIDTDDGGSELFRSPRRPSHHGAIYVSALGPSIFSPQIHQSYDAPRMAGFQRTERGIFYMTGSTAPSALEMIWNTHSSLSLLHLRITTAPLLCCSSIRQQKSNRPS